jgi:hypothetical protein
MATDDGGCVRSLRAVRPRKFGRKPRSRAPWRVDKDGENKAAWANATSSLGVADGTTEAHVEHGNGQASSRGRASARAVQATSGGTKLRCHKPVASEKEALMMMYGYRDGVERNATSGIAELAH